MPNQYKTGPTAGFQDTVQPFSQPTQNYTPEKSLTILKIARLFLILPFTFIFAPVAVYDITLLEITNTALHN